MAFEKFTQTGKRFKPIVSIWKRGQIGFSQGAVNKCKITRDDYILLFFDKETSRIGFMTLPVEEEGALKPKIISTGALVSAKSFLDFYGISYKETTRYELEYDEEAGLYVVDLKGGKIEKAS